ncbi:MAG: putative polysaccharide deacetylase [Firmicutes bacterium]|nr:putative polysaccharide deacetylase [Bacillota bacterium]MDI6704727.1 polysaccharide deacetylase family protein [Bacillota bacterium]
MRIIFIRSTWLRLTLALFLALALISGLAVVLFRAGVRGEQVFAGQPIYSGSDSKKAVTFTCNVDWGNEYIENMLEVMAEENIVTTFFITGRWAAKYPELTARIAESGHIIGNHGYSHRDHSRLSYEENLQEIRRTQDELESVIGYKPKFFAPPSGAFNKDTLRAAGELGCKVILWSIDTIDWKRDGTDKIIKRVFNKLHNGGIILMHPTDQTVEALPVIIKEIRNQGYEILSLEYIVNSIENKQ